MEVIFRYKKRKLKMHLVLAFLWSIFGIFSLIYIEDKTWLSYLYLPIGLLFFYFYFYDKNYGYLIHKNTFVRKQSFPKKRINLNDIADIKRDQTGITLLSKNNKKLLIDHSIIEKDDLDKLNTLLKKYGPKNSI